MQRRHSAVPVAASHRSGGAVMGWTLADVTFTFDGTETQTDPSGNNVAWRCFACGHPVLFVYQNGKPGASSKRPAQCRGGGCGRRYFLEPEYAAPEPVESRAPAGQMRIVLDAASEPRTVRRTRS